MPHWRVGARTVTNYIVVLLCTSFAACSDEKNTFFDCFQPALSEIPSTKPFALVLVGNFNARVWSRVADDDEWWRERGPHGYEKLNWAGKELLSFLSKNEPTVCNTSFGKDMYKQTWQHPKSK